MALRRDGAMLLLSTLQHYFSALFNCCFYRFCCCLFYRWKHFLASMVLVLRSFLHLVAQIMSFFFFYFMLLRERPRNQQKFNTHSYASLVSFHHCAVFVISFYFLLWRRKKKAFSLCLHFICAFQFGKLNTF